MICPRCRSWRSYGPCPWCRPQRGNALAAYLLFLALVFTLLACVTINGKHPAMILGREVLDVLAMDWKPLWAEPPTSLPVTEGQP